MAEDDTEKWTKATQKKSLVSGLGGIRGWFGALIGKPRPTVRENSVPEAEAPQEDSVAEDIKKFKSGVGNAVSKTTEALAPVAAKAKESVGNVDKPFAKRMLRVFLIIFFLVILGVVVISVVKLLSNGKNGNGNGNVTPTLGVFESPTPIPFIPFKPSLYVDDPQVLKLEEDISILERQLTQGTLRESQLTPPTLDFNIKL